MIRMTGPERQEPGSTVTAFSHLPRHVAIAPVHCGRRVPLTADGIRKPGMGAPDKVQRKQPGSVLKVWQAPGLFTSHLHP